MWKHVGLVRDGSGLQSALARLDDLACRVPASGTAAQNYIIVGRMIATAALARTESRGAHYRSDFPQRDPSWKRRLYLTFADDDCAGPLSVDTSATARHATFGRQQAA
jgi:L-aspartate oxidase